MVWCGVCGWWCAVWFGEWCVREEGDGRWGGWVGVCVVVVVVVVVGGPDDSQHCESILARAEMHLIKNATEQLQG